MEEIKTGDEVRICDGYGSGVPDHYIEQVAIVVDVTGDKLVEIRYPDGYLAEVSTERLDRY